MNTKIMRLTIGIGLLTSVCLTGSNYLMFSVIIPWMQRTRSVPYPEILGLISFIVVLFGTGGIWGFGIGWFVKADTRSASLSGAKNWLASIMVLAIILEIIMVPLITLSVKSSINLHLPYTMSFVVSVGLAAYWVTRKISERIGFENIKTAVGRNSGFAAGFGFMVASLALQFIFKWEVGNPVYGQYNMITITHICNAVAGLAGGLTIGWMYARSQSSIPMGNHVNSYLEHEAQIET